MTKKKLTLEEAIVKDVPYEIPEKWAWVKLGSVIKVSSGKGLTASKMNELGNVPVYGGNGVTGYHDEFIYDREQLIIGRVGAQCGNVHITSSPCWITDNALVVSYNKENIDMKFLYYILRKLNLGTYSTSSAQPVISGAKIYNIPIALPPLKEQQRIVYRIESLFEKLDKAKELIEEARDGFEKRKQCLLEKAFRGELTKEWRVKHGHENDLLGLLKKINSDLKKKFEFTEATPIFDLPQGWYWIKLKDVCEKFKYGTSSKSQSEGRVPVLRMGNLQKGKLDWNDLVYTSNEEEIKKYDLKPGDLLFNRTNSPELVGKTSIYNGEVEAIYAGYLIRIRTLTGIDSKYINYFMNSIFAKTRCMEVKSDGVSQSNINAEKLGDFDIPLPSLVEQKEITRILDKLLGEESKIDELTQLEEQIELIKKSILAKAFRGELRTNCEEDESAIELLKEILSKE